MSKFLILLFLTLVGKNLYAAEAGMPQLDPEYWASQAFWLVVIFLSIYVLIAKIFIPKIKSNIDMREDKIRKDLEEAKMFKEESEKKLKEYNKVITEAKMNVKKIISSSRQKLNDDLQLKKNEVQKKIDEEISNAEKEIKKFKKDSVDKIKGISEEITSYLIKDIFGEDSNKSSIEASVSQTLKESKIGKQ